MNERQLKKLSGTRSEQTVREYMQDYMSKDMDECVYAESSGPGLQSLVAALNDPEPTCDIWPVYGIHAR